MVNFLRVLEVHKNESKSIKRPRIHPPSEYSLLLVKYFTHLLQQVITCLIMQITCNGCSPHVNQMVCFPFLCSNLLAKYSPSPLSNCARYSDETNLKILNCNFYSPKQDMHLGINQHYNIKNK